VRVNAQGMGVGSQGLLKEPWKLARTSALSPVLKGHIDASIFTAPEALPTRTHPFCNTDRRADWARSTYHCRQRPCERGAHDRSALFTTRPNANTLDLANEYIGRRDDTHNL
jgi:hypothetical protein